MGLKEKLLGSPQQRQARRLERQERKAKQVKFKQEVRVAYEKGYRKGKLRAASRRGYEKGKASEQGGRLGRIQNVFEDLEGAGYFMMGMQPPHKKRLATKKRKHKRSKTIVIKV